MHNEQQQSDLSQDRHDIGFVVVAVVVATVPELTSQTQFAAAAADSEQSLEQEFPAVT